MSFKSSLVKSAGKLFGVFRASDLSLRGDVQPLKMSFFASGGTEVTFGGYKAHIFESGTSDNFEVRSGSVNIDILVVGGGGGGGGGGPQYGKAGAGGAGAVIYETGYAITSETNGPRIYPISIGAGGAYGNPASNGGDTSFSTTHIAAGGGGSTRRPPSPPWNSAGKPGGSGAGEGNGGGGGAGQADPTLSTYPGNATIYGNNGSPYGGQAWSAGAGGGAGSAGSNSSAGTGIRIDIVPGSTGPVTLPAPEIPLGYYWGGGGGSASNYYNEANGGEGGGGGGVGAASTGGGNAWTAGTPGGGPPGLAGPGGAGTGGGGGGGTDVQGGNGGSGIVIVKYLW